MFQENDQYDRKFVLPPIDEERGKPNNYNMQRRSYQARPYQHDLVDDKASFDTVGGCLGVTICIMLLIVLLFAISYPLTYYYYPDTGFVRGNTNNGNYFSPYQRQRW